MKNQMGIPEPCICFYPFLSAPRRARAGAKSLRYQNRMLSAAKMITTRIAHMYSFL